MRITQAARAAAQNVKRRAKKIQTLAITLACAGWLVGCASDKDNVTALRGGYDALNARQYDQAITAADQVLAANPKETLPAEAHYLRGRVFEERAMTAPTAAAQAGYLQSARTEYISAVGLPHKPDLEGRARAGVANVAFHQDDYATALDQWSAAVDKLDKPQDKALAYYRLGQTTQRLGKWDDADRYFAAAEQAAPGTDLAGRAKGHEGARGFVVQLATFADPAQASKAVTDLRQQGVVGQNVVDPANRSHFVLRVGPVGTWNEAKTLKTRFAATYPNAVILP